MSAPTSQVGAVPTASAPVPGRPPAARTTVPALDAPGPAATTDTRVRVRPGAIRESDILALVGAATSSAGLTWLLFQEFAPFSGAIGWVVVAWLLFAGVYALLVSLDENDQAVRDRIAAVVIHSLAFLLLVGLVFVITYVLGRGLDALHHLNFFTSDLSTTQPTDPLIAGGILHGIAGTLEQISIALVITIPLGLTCAVFLNEVPGGFSRFVRTIVEAMTALPSVVAGLFIFSTYILALQRPKSGFAAAMALSIMMLPIIIRSADVVIRLVPGNLREASLAMGAGKWRTVWHVVLPTARSGLATAIILGTARGIGETSPVLLTAGFSSILNINPAVGPQVSLPLLAFNLYQFPQATMRARSFGAAAVLLVLVLGLFITARTLGGRAAGDLSARQARRRAAESAADAQRFIARARGDAAVVSARPGSDVSALVGYLRGAVGPRGIVLTPPPPPISGPPTAMSPATDPIPFALPSWASVPDPAVPGTDPEPRLDPAWESALTSDTDLQEHIGGGPDLEPASGAATPPAPVPGPAEDADVDPGSAGRVVSQDAVTAQDAVAPQGPAAGPMTDLTPMRTLDPTSATDPVAEVTASSEAAPGPDLAPTPDGALAADREPASPPGPVPHPASPPDVAPVPEPGAPSDVGSAPDGQSGRDVEPVRDLEPGSPDEPGAGPQDATEDVSAGHRAVDGASTPPVAGTTADASPAAAAEPVDGAPPGATLAPIPRQTQVTRDGPPAEGPPPADPPEPEEPLS